LEKLFTLDGVPVFDNVLAESNIESKAVVRGTQALVQCCRCGFVFNDEFEPEKVQYGDNTTRNVAVPHTISNI